MRKKKWRTAETNVITQTKNVSRKLEKDQVHVIKEESRQVTWNYIAHARKKKSQKELCLAKNNRKGLYRYFQNKRKRKESV